MNTFQRFLSSVCLLMLTCCAFPRYSCRQSSVEFPIDSAPKYETRAVWLTTLKGLDWPSTRATSAWSIEEQKDELRTIILQLYKAGINTVLFQTRLRATTVYPSTIEPWDECLTGRPDGNPLYDPLAFAIEECHRYGMEIHAWVVTLPIGKWQSYGCRQLRKHHPELVKRIGTEAYLNPENSGTATYLSDICREIVTKYDVDGLHLDYLRYPETWSIKGREASARQNITRIASAIHHTVKTLKPWIKLSCSPIGKYDDLPQQSSYGWNARTRVAQEAQLWLSLGLMDELYPMMYFRNQHFFPFALDWKEHCAGRNVVAGLGLYQADREQQNWPISDIVSQIHFSRDIGIGQCYFRSKFLTDNTKGIYNILSSQFYACPALTPPLMCHDNQQVSAPNSLLHKAVGDTLLLCWSDSCVDAHRTYTLYGSTRWPVDIADARNILATKLRLPMVAIRRPLNMFFAVTASDAYGIESRACQEHVPDVPTSRSKIVRLFSTDKQHNATLQPAHDTLSISQWFPTADINSVILTDQTSRVVSRLPSNARMLAIRNLPVGVYYLYSASRKSKRHFLGTIIVSL